MKSARSSHKELLSSDQQQPCNESAQLCHAVAAKMHEKYDCQPAPLLLKEAEKMQFLTQATFCNLKRITT